MHLSAAHSKVVAMLLWIYSFPYLLLFVGVLGWSLFLYALLYVLSSFAIILAGKREMVALFLLSSGVLLQ